MAQFLTKQELRGMSQEDLLVHAGDLEKELFNLRNQRARDRRAVSAALMQQTRRQRARVLTLVTEKKQSEVAK